MLCIKYVAPDMEYIDEAQQIKITYRPQDETLEKFIEVNSGKHIYVEIDPTKCDFFGDLKHMRRFQELKKFDNWTLQIPFQWLKNEKNDFNDLRYKALLDCCNRFMFINTISNWETLDYILTLKPSEVYLTGILGFSLERAKKVCDNAGVGIRLYANVARPDSTHVPAIKKFFIRPEDLHSYELYTTGIEFEGDKVIQEVMYKVYSRGYWDGDLSEIIIGLGESLDGRRLPRNFGEHRTKCNKRCITGGSCGVCRAMKEFIHTMEKTNSRIIPEAKDKKKNES